MIKYEDHFHTLEEVIQKIQIAIHQRVGSSLVRIGDGEAFSMGYDLVPDYQKIMSGYDYAGVSRANPEVKSLLLKAIQMADIVGLSDNRDVFLCAPLIEKVLIQNHIHLPYICNARINWDLHGYGKGPLYRILQNQRVILVGRVARQAAPILKKNGLDIVATYTLEGFRQLNQCYQVIQSKNHTFDVALVAAGIPAVPLCVKIATECGKIAIDYGHAINDLITPGFNVSHLSATTVEWRKKLSRR